MPKKFWKFRNQADGPAELFLYGNISDQSWWGDDVTPKQFADELTALGAVNDISVRINSGGGDVFAAQTIGNLLEQHQAKVTAYIDGLCASAATFIACHCDKVIAATDSTYMVHPVKMKVYGYMDAETLKQYISALDTIRENVVSLYARKTGREKDEVAGWMDAESWWTGPQAKEKGFVDELTDDGQETIVENRSGMLFVNCVSMNLPFDKAPEFVRNYAVGSVLPQRSIQENKIKEEEKAMEIKTVEDLKKAYPELVNQVEQAAAQKAMDGERQRIKDIEEMALPGSEEITNKAKFTEPIDAAGYAKAILKHAKTQGASYLEQMKQDAQDSGANDVGGAPAPEGSEHKDSPAAMVAQAKKDAAVFLGKV